MTWEKYGGGEFILDNYVSTVRKGQKQILHWSCGLAVALLKMRLLRWPEMWS